ncbi:MAG: hypothetical protein Q8P18_32385 [Pseudomonadota bacterium]|nr:hypothetical protein [Pseudomonadota bacterium]
MRIAILLAVIGGLALAGSDVPAPGRPVGPGLPTPPIAPIPEENEPPDVEARARALVEEAGVCTEDVGCELQSFEALLGPDRCVAAFQCSAAFSAGADLTAFQRAAAPLIEEQRATGLCATAGCSPPSELVAACVEGRCQILPSSWN